jgi:hypothetical protein
MKQTKLNFGYDARKHYGGSQKDAKQVIREAHTRGKCLDLRIKDFAIVQQYLYERPRSYTPRIPTLQDRLKAHLIRKVPTDHSSQCCNKRGRIADYDATERLWVIVDNAVLETSRKNWYYHASWLCGRDDGSYFTHRIPSTIDNIPAALNWITPAAVQKAKAAGKRILRQGDVWFVETRFRDDHTSDMPWGHSFDPMTRNVTHVEHGSTHIPFTFRAYQNKAINGRSD